METTAALAPVTHPRSAARIAGTGRGAEAVGVAFAISDGGPAALVAHDLDGDVVAALLAR